MATILVLGCRPERPDHGDAAGPRRPRRDRAGARPGRPRRPAAEALGRAGSGQGVGQFRHAALHAAALAGQDAQAELPDVLDELDAAGGLRMQPDRACCRSSAGARSRPGDERFETVTARRPVLEAVLAAAAARTPGVTVRRGIAVTGLLDRPLRGRRRAPRRRACVTADGGRVRADLVVDCRRPPVARWPTWLAAIGARRRPRSARTRGFVYYGRHFRSADGAAARGARRRCSSTTTPFAPDAARRQRHLGRRADHQLRRTGRCGRCATRPRWEAALAPLPAGRALGARTRRRADHRAST